MRKKIDLEGLVYRIDLSGSDLRFSSLIPALSQNQWNKAATAVTPDDFLARVVPAARLTQPVLSRLSADCIGRACVSERVVTFREARPVFGEYEGNKYLLFRPPDMKESLARLTAPALLGGPRSRTQLDAKTWQVLRTANQDPDGTGMYFRKFTDLSVVESHPLWDVILRFLPETEWPYYVEDFITFLRYWRFPAMPNELSRREKQLMRQETGRCFCSEFRRPGSDAFRLIMRIARRLLNTGGYRVSGRFLGDPSGTLRLHKSSVKCDGVTLFSSLFETTMSYWKFLYYKEYGRESEWPFRWEGDDVDAAN